MLRLVARYADAWNTAWHTDATVVKERHEQLRAACAEVGRDPATIILNAGIIVRPVSGEGNEERAITGSPEEIAHQLHAFAGVGVGHLIAVLDPLNMQTIEQFGRIAEIVRAL